MNLSVDNTSWIASGANVGGGGSVVVVVGVVVVGVAVVVCVASGSRGVVADVVAGEVGRVAGSAMVWDMAPKGMQQSLSS